MKKLYNLSARELVSFIITVLPVCILIYALASGTQGVARPKAKAGLLDLSGWDMDRDGPVALNGEWRFYWNHLIVPAAGDTALAADYIKVPGIWNGHENKGQKLPAAGFATYSLDLRLKDTSAMYAFNLHTMSNAYTLYVNGQLLAVNGKTGTSENQWQPAYRPQVVVFKPASRELHITVQVANFAHCKGGFWLPVELGKAADIQKEHDTRYLLEMFLFGCLFIMALYHFSLYLLRRKDSTTLFFGLMCLVIGLRSLLTGENLVNEVLPGLDWFMARKTEYLFTFLSVPIYVTFVHRLYTNEWNRLVYRLIVSFGLLMALFVLLTPTRIFTNTSYVFTGYAWLTSIYTIFIFTRALLRRKEGAGIFLSTSLFFLLTIVNDTLNQLELIHTGLYLSLGLFVVTFAQSYILSLRFANAFRLSEIYAATFQKFVPAQFLAKIGKDGIESIRAGNAEKSEATVMFSDIRSFTSLSESMAPDDVFRMLNDYLSSVEPPIRANNGFVDKYMGDGIMALFEDGETLRSADYAVMAALDMQAAMRVFNARRTAASLPPLHTGIGLHTGDVIMGTLGGNERMDSTAIGDAVNLASRIEGMTKMYGVALLASDYTLRRMQQSEKFLFRFVDKVIAKGKSEPVAIWEVMGLRSDPAVAAQLELVAAYEKGIAAFQAKDLAAAKTIFESCLRFSPDDSLSKIYLERCLQNSSDHITRLDEK